MPLPFVFAAFLPARTALTAALSISASHLYLKSLRLTMAKALSLRLPVPELQEEGACLHPPAWWHKGASTSKTGSATLSSGMAQFTAVFKAHPPIHSRESAPLHWLRAFDEGRTLVERLTSTVKSLWPCWPANPVAACAFPSIRK